MVYRTRRREPQLQLFPDLHRIQCPTLVLGGEDDPIHPIESQADIAAALPPHLVQFERFANCRHAVMPDAPERDDWPRSATLSLPPKINRRPRAPVLKL